MADSFSLKTLSGRDWKRFLDNLSLVPVDARRCNEE